MPVSAQLTTLLQKAAQQRASDVHLHAGAKVRFRINGQFQEKGSSELPGNAVQSLIKGGLNTEQLHALKETGQLDAALPIEGVGRVRVNIFRQQHGFDAVFRIIPTEPPTLDDLVLPETLKSLTTHRNGLVLVTGPAGSGKTSTIAALVEIINRERRDHIITLEDPIEFQYKSKGCIVNQRQIGLHTKGFAPALRAALREDPDVIVVGELRDLDSISLAVTAAETGHLVFSTIHTRTSIEAINRVINVFPLPKQPQIRAQLTEALRGVVSQRLILSKDGTRRFPATELLICNQAVKGLIRDKKTEMITSIQQLGRDGMMLMDKALANMVRGGMVTREEALKYARNPESV
jgi:twitching motility protein PilT